ncbi:MAG: hypothetical protein WC829_07995 [Hyphomicrobium sp.]|jgi:hypothetical protein
MLAAFSLSSLLVIVANTVLFVGAGAVAVWAARQPDQISSLIAGLMEGQDAPASTGEQRPPTSDARPRTEE